MLNQRNYANRTSKYPIRLWAVLVFVVLLVGALSYGLYIDRNHSESNSVVATDDQGWQDTSPEIQALAAELPKRLNIPTLGIDTQFEYLDLLENGEVGVPESFETVGWYIHSALPDSTGPTVVIGHVDSKDGPAVFYGLGELKAGDQVTITDSSGQDITYEVTSLERYRQDEFPTEKVYGNTTGSELRLITCTGNYLHDQSRYTHNLVVYAKQI